MILFFFAYILIGMTFAAHDIQFMKNTTPPIWTFIMQDARRYLKEAGFKEDVEDNVLDKVMICGITLVWISIWPILCIWRMR